MKWKDKRGIENVIGKNEREITRFLSHYPPSTLNLILYKAFRSTKAPPFSPEYVLVKNIRGKEEKIRLIPGNILVHILFCDSGKNFMLGI